MKHRSKNSIAFLMMILILFSTVGFNVIITFCGGCESEHVSVALTAGDSTSECECCAKSQNTFHCCSSEAAHENEHHQTKSILAQLKYDSTEAKSKMLKVVLPVITFFSIAISTVTSETTSNFVTSISETFAPPPSGRSILTSICILRI